MTPRRIIDKAASLGINILAVCDHNSAENVAATIERGRGKGIMVIPGMEICSCEEVHVLGLFRNLDDALEMQELVFENIQPGKNNEDVFGMQVIVNTNDEVLGFDERMLIGATGLSINKLVALIHQHNGLAAASHIDRAVFGIIGQLGFISPDSGFDALEISFRTEFDAAVKRFGSYTYIPWISSSDAHRIDDIGRRTTRFSMHHATFEELALTLAGAGGRSVSF
jgi:hypothetical protein